MRDIGHIIAIAIQALMLLSPIFYSIDVIPQSFKWFYYINPATYFIEDTRKVLVWGEIPSGSTYLAEVAVALIICFLGFKWFRKTKHGFADVL